MLIDWFTVAAQAVNFLILVWLLKRFLYTPILDAIDAREAGIAAAITDAETRRADAKRERDEFEEKNQAFDQQRETLMRQSTDEAATERQRLLNKARNEADALRVKREDSLKREYAALSAELTRITQGEVFAIARKTLSDLADADLEEQMTGVFVRRLKELDETAKSEIAQALGIDAFTMTVRSAFDLRPKQRTVIQNAINAAFSPEVSLNFETVPDVIIGIELTCGGRKISWSIAEYLVSLEQRIGELLPEEQPAPAVALLEENAVV